MKSRLSFLSSEGNRGNMRSSLFLTAVLSLLLCTVSASTGPDYGAHPRFICTPIPVDADPACFGGPGMGGSGASVGPGPHGTPSGAAGGGPSPSGWWGMPEEAQATILHLRESLLKERETILEQRETIRELNAKLTLCEGFGRHMTADDDHSGLTRHRLQGPASRSRHGGVGLRLGGHRGSDQPGRRGSNLLPDAPHHSAVGGHRSSAGHVGDNNSGARKDKHTITMTTAGEMTSSPEQMDRMLQALKERLGNLQKRNMSSAYSSSLKDLLQRKITTLEQQLHPPHPDTSALSSPDHHDDHDDDDGEGHHDHDDGHDDDSHPDDHDDDDGHHEDMEHGDPHKDYDDGDGDGIHDDDHDEGHHGNEDDGYGYVAQTGYRPHSNKLETLLSQLHLSGPNRKKAESPDSFQIGFPMRTNYMYSRVKRTLLNEIFALTLCLWIKGGTGPGLGTPFSYSVPGQANELVLIEWGSNPMELLVDDKAVTLPLSLSDGKWHHVCVTWSTREGQWEAYQDGVQRGSGDSLSPWHPIKPGGVFIIGQEQDTLGGRFDATQSFVGEISDLQMWSHVLTASDIHSLASCGSHLTGDVITWSETELELHGGVSVYPFDPCH